MVEAIGLTIEAIMIARISAALFDPQGSDFLSRYEEMQSYIISKEVDPALVNSLRHYSQTIWATIHGAPGWNELMKDLPDSITSAIKLETCERAVSGLLIFQGIRQSDKLQLVEHLTPFSYVPGELIAQQNDASSSLLILTSGCIQIFRDDMLIARQRIDETVFDGERELLFGEPRARTIVAESFVDGWKLKRSDLIAIVRFDEEFKRTLLRNTRFKYPNDFTGIHRMGDPFAGPVSEEAEKEPETVFSSSDFVDIENMRESNDD
jgi:hypothetical protein